MQVLMIENGDDYDVEMNGCRILMSPTRLVL